MIRILYHSGCWDGFGAAWAAYKHFGTSGVSYIPVSYGRPLPRGLEKEDAVYILDFAYDRETLDALASRVAQLEVHDHHKSHIEELKTASYFHFDLYKSGAVLAWERFHPDVPVPKLLEYVQARDLWKQDTVEKGEEIIAWLRSYEHDFELWDELVIALETRFVEIAMAGGGILRAERQMVQTMVRHPWWTTIGGHEVPVVNATTLYSECGQALCQAFPEAPFAAYFTVRSDGVVQWGLRGLGKIDCSAVAKKYGGGGHHNAAGFVERGEDFALRIKRLAKTKS